jgi:predicted phage terminase large subunit-like protein
MKVLARWWARRRYIWKQDFESSLEELQASLSAQRAQEKRDAAVQLRKEAEGISEGGDSGDGRMMLPVVPVKPTTDKRSRLQVVAPYIKDGTVLFPRTGCEQLLGQIFNLGVESHDDLCDGLTTLLNGLVEQGLELPKIHWIET